MMGAVDGDDKDDGNDYHDRKDYHDHDNSEHPHKMTTRTGSTDATTTTTTTTTLSPPLPSSASTSTSTPTSTSLSLLTNNDFPLDAILKIVDCLSTNDTIHLSNTCQTLHTKIMIEWGGWECSSASCSSSSSSSSSSSAAASSSSKCRPNRIFHALMVESGRRRHRNFLLSHSSRQQQRREKQMTTDTMRMRMVQDSNDNDNDDRTNNYCRETTTATTTATIINNKNNFDVDIDINTSFHIRSSSDIMVGGCHRCQKRTCSDCTECCRHCTETLCSKGGCCEATDQKVSKCCKCHRSTSSTVDGQQQHQQQQPNNGNGTDTIIPLEDDSTFSCHDCEKYCDICQLYFCSTCTERISMTHPGIMVHNNRNNGTTTTTSIQTTTELVQTQCGICLVNKPHGGQNSCGIHTPSHWQLCSNADCHRVMCYACVYFCPEEACQVIYCNSCRERHTHCQQCGYSNHDTMDDYNLYSELT